MTLPEILLSWAVLLSGYPAPAEVPDVVAVPSSVLADKACSGDRNCKALGWFGGGVQVLLDERLHPDSDMLAASIVVHEMVHYLQGQSGAFGHDCASAVQAEREAYAVQKEFLLRNGVFGYVGLGFLRSSC